MLNIEIDDTEIENSIKQLYGENTVTIKNAFVEFIQQQKNKYDIGISIKELDQGESIDLATVVKEISSKYD
jgi:hypothetical protein